MESLAVSSASSVGGVFSFLMLTKLVSWYIRRKAKAVLLLKGKTTLCNKWTSNNVIFLDIDNVLTELPEYEKSKDNPAKLFLLYPIVKQRVDVLVKGFRKPVVFVSRNWDLLRVMNVSKKNIIFLCNSQEGHKKSQLLYSDPAQFAQDDILRLKYLHNVPKKQIKICESLADIDKHIKDSFGLTNVAM